jgi:subtilase family serine protease
VVSAGQALLASKGVGPPHLGVSLRLCRTLSISVGVCALAAAASVPAAARAVPAGPVVIISPGVMHARGPLGAPPSTAYCERHYKIACYQPAQLRRAYNLPPLLRRGIDGAGQTIVIVDSFGSPTAAHDLSVFDQTFGLPPPPSLKVIQPAGKVAPYQPTGTREGWAGETALDVEYAHAMAPGAKILLVETPTSEEEGTSGFPQIVEAEEYVINHHLGGVISQSFSATEETFPSTKSLLNLRGAYLDAQRKGVTVLAAAGDSGAADVRDNEVDYYPYPVTSWPDSDPLVTGVGGTQLHLDAAGRHLAPDSVWNDTYNAVANEFINGNASENPLAGGGGKSTVFSRPRYQNGVARVVGSRRGVPDISMSAACDGAVDTYQSFPGQQAGWYPTCGTSEATPLFAGVVALADQVAGHPLGLINPALYALSASHAPGIVDVRTGNNTVSFERSGASRTVRGFSARPGYDLASGVGTVDADPFVFELAKQAGPSASHAVRPGPDPWPGPDGVWVIRT